VDNLHEVLTNLENIQLETTINKNRQYACTLAVECV